MVAFPVYSARVKHNRGGDGVSVIMHRRMMAFLKSKIQSLCPEEPDGESNFLVAKQQFIFEKGTHLFLHQDKIAVMWVWPRSHSHREDVQGKRALQYRHSSAFGCNVVASLAIKELNCQWWHRRIVGVSLHWLRESSKWHTECSVASNKLLFIFIEALCVLTSLQRVAAHSHPQGPFSTQQLSFTIPAEKGTMVNVNNSPSSDLVSQSPYVWECGCIFFLLSAWSIWSSDIPTRRSLTEGIEITLGILSSPFL